MVVRKSEKQEGSQYSAYKKSHNTGYKQKTYSSDWKRSATEEIWESCVGVVDKSHRRYFNFVKVVLKEDEEKITYLFKNIANNYNILKDIFNLPCDVTASNVLTIEIIDFIMNDYCEGKDHSLSELSKRQEKHYDIPVIEVVELDVMDDRFKIMHGINIDYMHTKLISEDKLKNILRLTTLEKI